MTKKISKIKLNNNFLEKNINEHLEFKNFLKRKKWVILKKELLYSSTFTLIYFFSKYWELGNLNNKLYSKYFFSSFKYKKKLLKKYFFFKKKKLIFNNYINERLFFLKKFFYFLFLYIENKNKNKCFINYKKKK